MAFKGAKVKPLGKEKRHVRAAGPSWLNLKFKILLVSLFLSLLNARAQSSPIADSSKTPSKNSLKGDDSLSAQGRGSVGPVSVSMQAVPFAYNEDYIDVRGVGDTGWTESDPQHDKNEFSAVLRSFDPGGLLLQGDLNFLNWESSVGPSCQKWNQVQFPFLSPPAALKDALDFGFNLFGVSNNHAEDCAKFDDKTSGVMRTRYELSTLAKGQEMLWHGIGMSHEISKVSTRIFQLKGKKIKVAFAAVSFLNWRTHSTSRGEGHYHGEDILQSMQRSDAKIKILSVHTQSTLEQGKSYASRFIKEAGGDIVFAQGEHKWGEVEAIEKTNGGKGIVFHGLGNFSHRGCVSNHKNILARVLLKKETLELAQIQIIPFSNLFQGELKLHSAKNGLPSANFDWKRAVLQADRNVSLAFSNFSP